MQPPASYPNDPPERGDPYLAYRRAAARLRAASPTGERLVRWLAGAAAAVAAAWTLWYFANLVVYLVVGMLLSYLMRPVVDRLQGLGLGRIPAILVTFVLVFGTITVLLTELVPFMTRQVTDLSDRLALEEAGQVVRLRPGGQTEGAVLEAGDLIVGVEGRPWEGYEELQALVELKQPGEQVALLVEGVDGTQRYVSLTVRRPERPPEASPEAPPDAPDADVPVRIEALGLTVQEVPVSPVATAIERRVRDVVPVRPGALIRGFSAAVDELFQEERLTRLAGSVVSLFADLFYAVIVIPFVAFFSLKDGMRIRHGLLRLVPNRYFEITLALVEKIEAIIGRYFQALLVQCLSVGTLVAVLLYAVGLDYALAVGIFAGLANTIPYFGPLMGFLLGTAVGVVQTGDFSLVPGVLLAMALVRLVDDVFFQPFLFSRAAQMHPLIILFVVLMGAQLAGLIGMLVAIPATTILRVTVEQVLWSVRNYRILQNV